MFRYECSCRYPHHSTRSKTSNSNTDGFDSTLHYFCAKSNCRSLSCYVGSFSRVLKAFNSAGSQNLDGSFSIGKRHNCVVRRDFDVHDWGLVEWNSKEKRCRCVLVRKDVSFSVNQPEMTPTSIIPSLKTTHFWINVSMEIVFSPSVPSSLTGMLASISFRSSAFKHGLDVCTLFDNTRKTPKWLLKIKFLKFCIFHSGLLWSLKWTLSALIFSSDWEFHSDGWTTLINSPFFAGFSAE